MGKVLAVIRMFRPFVAFLASAFVLSGCGNQPGGDALTQALTGMAGELVGRRGEAEPAQPLTRAMIEASGQPMMLAIAPSRGTQALLVPVARNRGVDVWATGDSATLSLRDGIFIASRGLGNDLMSAAAPSGAQITAGAGNTSRSYFTLDGEDRTQRADFACTLSRHAAAPIEIVERQFEVHEVKETCIGAENGFVNRYWIDRRGRIVQSLQWVGTDVGFLQLADLSN